MNISIAKNLDQKDLLAQYKAEFFVPAQTIYLDGNSLGLLSHNAKQRTLDFLDSWEKLGIDGWTKGKQPWFYLAEELGAAMAPLLGAHKNEVIITNSATVNLHQLLTTFYKPTGQKTKIVADELAFPTDLYAIKSHLALHGINPDQNLRLIKSRGGHTIFFEDILSQLDEDVALLILPTVLYRSGQLLDVAAITAAAHKYNILVGFDACHSVGAVEHQFHNQNVDFALFCTYKYLNGGPGSVGGLFVHQKHLGKDPGLAGWFSSDKTKQFDMSSTLHAATTAGAFQMGTPHILSMAGLAGSLELFNKVGMSALREKSLRITAYLRELVETELSSFDITIVTPKDDTQRGGHIAMTHPHAVQITQALKRYGVIPDFRPPNIIRLAPVAFYTSFCDVYHAVEILKDIMERRKYLQETSVRELIS